MNELTTLDLATCLQCKNSVYIHNPLNLATSNLYTPAVTTVGGNFDYYDHAFNFNDIIAYSNSGGDITLSTKDGSNLLDAYGNHVKAQGALWTSDGKNNQSHVVYTFTSATSVNASLIYSNLPSSNTTTITITDYNPSLTYVVCYAWGFIS